MPIDRTTVLKRAEDLLRQGRRDAAIGEYLRILDDQPSDLTTANIVGDLYVQGGQIEKAAAQYGKIADFYHQEGFLPKAAALYKKILKIKPNDERALLRTGEIAEAQGLVADAKTAFLNLAEQRRRRGDRRAAAHLLVRIGALDPGDVPAQRRAGAALMEIDDRPGAAAVYKDLAFHLSKRNRRIDAVDLLREAAELEALGPDEAGPLLEKHRRFAAGQAPASERPRPEEFKTIAALLASLGLDEQALKALADADAPSSPTVAADASTGPGSGSPVSREDAGLPARPPLRVVSREAAPSLTDGALSESTDETGPDEVTHGHSGLEPAGAAAGIPTSGVERVRPSTLRPLENLGVVPSPVEGREPQGRPELVEGRATTADAAEVDLTDALDVQPVEEELPEAETSAESASLFADLQDLFEELKDEATGKESAEMLARELDLGERYYQAGMIDHAARALQMAARAPAHRFRAAALLGRIELERGRAWDAIRWFERAAEAQAPAGEQAHELLYDLANTLESVGERERALAVFIELRMDDPRYRDVSRRVSRLLKR